MNVIEQEVACPIEGYEDLMIVVNIGMTQAGLDRARARGAVAPAVVGLQHWEEVAAARGLLAIDPATGEPTGDPLPQPELPLTEAGLAELPFVLVSYLSGDQVIAHALRAYREDHFPNFSRR